MFVTDPNAAEGGEFQYFHGTREEMAELQAVGRKLPAERVIAPDMPGPGYVVLMQGNYVVHQAKAVQGSGERITLVNGYSYADMDTFVTKVYVEEGLLVLVPTSLSRFSVSLSSEYSYRDSRR